MSSDKSNNELEPTLPKIRVPGADDPKDPVEVFKIQFENFKSLKKIKRVPKQVEVLVVGGGIIGSFVAYWLKTKAPNLEVAVIEKDSSVSFKYCMLCTYWSIGGVRQQFSLPENIRMSMFGAEFLKDVQKHLKCDEKDDPIDLPFNHDGYLFLASKKNADLLYQNHKVQLANNAKVKLLNKEELQSTFKWLNTDDLELGSFGYQNEGWVDPRKFLLAVRNKAVYLGADFIDGEVIKIEADANEDWSKANVTNENRTLNVALVDTFDGKLVPIKYQTCVNAAGPWAAHVARLAGIGTADTGPLSVSLPVEARKRYIYMFYAEHGPILKVPLTIDPSGVWWRRQGLSNYYFCGRNQREDEEPEDADLAKVDHGYFEAKIKPVLVERVPSFRDLRVVNSFAGYYEFNSLDQNLIIGRHPVRSNMIFTNGSSGHGLQHAAAIGNAVTEIILYGDYKAVDLKRFGFQRVLRDQPIKEIDVV